MRHALLALILAAHAVQAAPLLVIAHRGASGYLPEHTLEAKALAVQMGADYLEQDVVMSKDDVPFVTHDVTLDEVTDVAARFPGRARADGHYYVLDFAAAELRRLSRHERVKGGKAAYPGRFPVGSSHFVMVSLAEEIEFVRGINKSTGRHVGLYTPTDFDAMRTARGIADVATYADGIGPSIDRLVQWPPPGAKARATPLGAWAKQNHLLMHPYTLRLDDLPKNAPSAAAVLDALTQLVGVDGLSSDFPDVPVCYRDTGRWP